MTAGFTRGPWRAIDKMIVVVEETHGYSTCIANAQIGGSNGETMAANAHLIAAAPDLLAACEAEEAAQDARANCPECDGEDDWTHCGPCSLRFGTAIDLRRAAIAKATGK